MRLLLKICLLIFLLSVVISNSISTKGDFECVVPECWNYINRGKTTLDDAEWLLGYFHGEKNVARSRYGIRWYQTSYPPLVGTLSTSDQGDTVSQISIAFRDYSHPTLEYLFRLFGEPSTVYVQTANCFENLIIYKAHDIVVWLDWPELDSAIQPTRTVWTIEFGSSELLLSVNKWDTYTVFDWQGYTDYCQLLNDPSP